MKKAGENISISAPLFIPEPFSSCWRSSFVMELATLLHEVYMLILTLRWISYDCSITLVCFSAPLLRCWDLSEVSRRKVLWLESAVLLLFLFRRLASWFRGHDIMIAVQLMKNVAVASSWIFYPLLIRDKLWLEGTLRPFLFFQFPPKLLVAEFKFHLR